MKKNKPAFTLPEVLLSLAIVGVLAAIAIPQVYIAVNKSQNSAAVNRAAEQLELHNQNMIQNYIAKNTNQAAITTLNEMTNPLTVESFAEGLGLTEIEADINDFKLAVTVPTPLFIQSAYALSVPGVQATVGSGNVGVKPGSSSNKDAYLTSEVGKQTVCEDGNTCDDMTHGVGGGGGGGTGGSNTDDEGTGGYTPNVGGNTNPSLPTCSEGEELQFWPASEDWVCVPIDLSESETPEEPETPAEEKEEEPNGVVEEIGCPDGQEYVQDEDGVWACKDKEEAETPTVPEPTPETTPESETPEEPEVPAEPETPEEPEVPAEPTAPVFYKSYSLSNSDVALYFLEEIDTEVTEPNGVLTHFYIDANGPKGKPNKAGVDLFEYVLLNNGKIRTVND